MGAEELAANHLEPVPGTVDLGLVCTGLKFVIGESASTCPPERDSFDNFGTRGYTWPVHYGPRCRYTTPTYPNVFESNQNQGNRLSLSLSILLVSIVQFEFCPRFISNYAPCFALCTFVILLHLSRFFCFLSFSSFVSSYLRLSFRSSSFSLFHETLDIVLQGEKKKSLG